MSFRKYRTPLPSFPKFLPVTEIPSEPKYKGKLSESSVLVTNPEEAQELHENGCFGVSNRFQKQFVNERFYEIRDGFASEEENSEENTILGRCELTEDLKLFPEEAFFLHFSLKVLRIFDENDREMTSEEILMKFIEAKRNFVTNFVAYQYCRAKNWVVKDGTNFGSDFLLYQLGPQYFHSQFTVKVRNTLDTEDKFPSKQFLGWYRISETSKKECLVIEVVPPSANSMDLLTRLRDFRVRLLTFKRFNLWKGTKSVST
ncbi:tRNA-splicing endonuclease subunit Sen2 [Culicoides brevitarsis]|uniref:tRNA-splicing endonuclease subunit Sen2 n=1 Tax=Culicoides brevitarsis TaxID=469753 RepID=UPI00307B3174